MTFLFQLSLCQLKSEVERLQALKLQHIQKFIDGLRYGKIIIYFQLCSSFRKSDILIDYMYSLCEVLNIELLFLFNLERSCLSCGTSVSLVQHSEKNLHQHLMVGIHY